MIEGSVTVKTLLVDGRIEGDITATESVRLGASAIVIGDITTGNLSVEPSASFQGKANIGSTSTMPSSAQTQKQASPAEAPINGQINGKMPAPTPTTSTAKASV